MSLEISNLNVGYDGTPILRDLSLTHKFVES